MGATRSLALEENKGCSALAILDGVRFKTAAAAEEWVCHYLFTSHLGHV